MAPDTEPAKACTLPCLHVSAEAQESAHPHVSNALPMQAWRVGGAGACRVSRHRLALGNGSPVTRCAGRAGAAVILCCAAPAAQDSDSELVGSPVLRVMLAIGKVTVISRPC